MNNNTIASKHVYIPIPPNSTEKFNLTDDDKNRVKYWTDLEYFKTYEKVKIHRIMMQDQQRMDFYHRSIVRNPDLFKGKTVLDVGCGLGILSMFAAKAGAKKVYAVEASEKIGKLAEEVFWDNELDDIIETKIGNIEDVEINDKIDIIVSEWMGCCLLYEQMLPSVIFARDKYKPEIMIPSRATVVIRGYYDEDYFQYQHRWTTSRHFDEIDMSTWGHEMTRRLVTSQCPEESIVTSAAYVGRLDICSISQSEARQIKETEFELKFRYETANTIHGLVVFFETFFNGREGRVTLTNSPLLGVRTHWLQSVCVFEEPVKVKFKKRSVKGKFKLNPESEYSRGIKIEVELDANYVEAKKLHYEFVLPG